MEAESLVVNDASKGVLDISILLVEDDENLGYLLTENLKMKGYSAVLCRDGNEGWAAFCRESFDLCIVDVMLPKRDGFSLAQQIRTKNKQVPIMFLTAKNRESDVIRGFELGCDDYVSKPFSSQELFYRIRALLKRSGHIGRDEHREPEVFTYGELQFDAQARTLKDPNGVRKLSTKENELLKVFASNPNRLISRTTILTLVWGNDDYFASKSMDVYLSRLRKLLADYPFFEIQNVHGTGFKLLVKPPDEFV